MSPDSCVESARCWTRLNIFNISKNFDVFVSLGKSNVAIKKRRERLLAIRQRIRSFLSALCSGVYTAYIEKYLLFVVIPRTKNLKELAWKELSLVSHFNPFRQIIAIPPPMAY